MNRIPRTARRASAGAALAALVLAASACSGNMPEADVANGQQIFTGACGGCHTLADAGTTGTESGAVAGPNLDDGFRGARDAGIPESTYRAVVHRWIYDAQPPMPRRIVEGQDAHDVAAYVASVAGRDETSRVTRARPFPPEDNPVEYDQTRGTPFWRW